MNLARISNGGSVVPRRAISWWFVASLLAVTLGLQQAAPTPAMAAPSPVDLGTASAFAVMAGSTITNTGPSLISGNGGADIGVWPGTAIIGFPPGVVLGGTIHSADSVTQLAQTDLTTAYNTAAGLPSTVNLTGQDLGGLTLTPGIYKFDTSAQLTGALTLNGLGDPDSVFVFQIGTTLTTASNSSINFINGGQSCRVYWQVGSSATLGTTTQFRGTILALTSITALTGTTVDGRLLARNGAVTLDTNAVTNGLCTATLHVIKHVVNDDGRTAVASNFTVHLKTGGTDVLGSPLSGAESPGTTYTVPAGTYAVSENPVFDYTATYSGDGDSSGTITLAAGDNKTVIITNNDVPTLPQPTLHVIKHVVNDDGRTSVASDFTVHVKTGGNDVAASPAPGAESPGTSYHLAPGSYAVSEDASATYTPTYSGDGDSSGNITLASGDNKTVIITNNDVPVAQAPATLHVIKHVINDDGRTASAASFTVHVKTGGTDVAASPAPGVESPGTTYTVAAGTYVVSENPSAEYTATYSGDGDSSGTITLAPGDNKTVTITNNDVPITPPQPPVLLITKTADPPGGGIVDPGQTIEYRISYTNSGLTTIPVAALVDTLSPAVTYQPGTLVLNGVPISDLGHYDSLTRSINVPLGLLPPGANGVLVFKVTVGPWSESRAGIRNVGSWTATGTLVGTTPPVYHFVDAYDISKRVRNTSGTTIRTGSVLLWTIVVTNRGIVPATDVVVSDRVPASTTYVNNSITGPGHDDSDVPALLWNIGTIGVGQSVTLTFKSTVNANVTNGTSVANRAWVRGDQGPPKDATVTTTEVHDTTTVAARTSGAEDTTLGFMGLLAMLMLGLAWSGRSGGVSGDRRGRRIAASLLLGTMLALGGMEVGASFGLPLPSPGEALSSTIHAVSVNTSASRVSASASSSSSGRVSLPTIGVNVRLVEGRSMKALAKGVWHQPPSAKPGNSGACVIAGHRVRSQFARLRSIRVGDPVRVTSGGHVYRYRVASVSTRSASGDKLGFRTGVKEKLVLYTCVPRWQGNKRTVVVCYRVRK